MRAWRLFCAFGTASASGYTLPKRRRLWRAERGALLVGALPAVALNFVVTGNLFRARRAMLGIPPYGGMSSLTVTSA
jgi:hypothetical protein